jgi:hypothetical protein
MALVLSDAHGLVARTLAELAEWIMSPDGSDG